MKLQGEKKKLWCLKFSLDVVFFLCRMHPGTCFLAAAIEQP